MWPGSSWPKEPIKIWTKTDSETTPDSETRDSETARRIQKIDVVFRNYFVGFRNYFVGFRNCSWYSETIFVVFRNYFVGFRNYSWYSETIFAVFRNYFRRIQCWLYGFSQQWLWYPSNSKPPPPLANTMQRILTWTYLHEGSKLPPSLANTLNRILTKLHSE